MPRRTRRNFLAEFKAQVVLEVISGQRLPAEICREHKLSPSVLNGWKDTVLQGLPVLFEGEDRRSQEQTRIAELEQLAGRQALELAILKKACRLLPGTPTRNGRSS